MYLLSFPWCMYVIQNITMDDDRFGKRQTAKTNLYKLRMQYSNSAVERMNLPRDIGGRSVVKVPAQNHITVDWICTNLFSAKSSRLTH